MKHTYVDEVLASEPEQQYTVLGWITRKRVHGGVLFLNVTDSTGALQVVVEKENVEPETFSQLRRLKEESAVRLEGLTQIGLRGLEFHVRSAKVEAEASLHIHPSPRNLVDPFDPVHTQQMAKHPSFYLRNPKVAAALKFKLAFRRNLEQYFADEGFVQFEPPTITLQTLYDDKGAFWFDLNGQQVSLSRCATFHLEPALFAYERVFALTNSFANEMSRSDRHLGEYTHLKAEMAWVNLDDLIGVAGNMYYAVAQKTVNDCAREIETLGLANTIDSRIAKINPANQLTITYDEALLFLLNNGVRIEYGKSIPNASEQLITAAHGEKFVWIKYVPCSAEGFPFKRKLDAPHLTMTCDLVAPHGYGEILGTAEKITDKAELLERMAEKGKTGSEELARYNDYIALREYGLPEHGGIGMGIERAVRYVLDLPHVRFTRPFPVLHGTRVAF